MSRGRAELLIPSSFTSCMEYLKNIGSSLKVPPDKKTSWGKRETV